ncbi:hypothetical protein ALC57_03438 [Trachymyrmex cornetzi]|uniref:Uncharacterized protein n=1 Tax=Trachymyrmex cornetzi TaxID=471704 RepID=A0A195EFP6_9HYME|nr:hypothetical protein ALC57_03438 [Trachymyrmex cornetzi]
MRFTSPSRVDSTTKRERRCHDATSVARTTPGQWGYLPPTPKPLEGVQQSRRSSLCSFHCAHVVVGGLVGAIPPSSPSSSCRCTLEGSKVEKMYIFLSSWQDLKEPVLPISDLFTTQLVLHILQRHKFHVYSKILQILSALFTPFNRNQSICCAMILNKKEDIAKQPATAGRYLYAKCNARQPPIENPPRIILLNGIPSFTSLSIHSDTFSHMELIDSNPQFGSCDRFRDCFVLQVFCFISILRIVKYVIRSSLLKAITSYPVDDANITRCLRQMAIYAIASWGVMMLHKVKQHSC